MSTMKIEDGDVEVTVQRTQSNNVLLDTADVCNFKPLEAVRLGKMLIRAAVYCVDIGEVHSITEDLRRFIDGGPVDGKGDVIELSALTPGEKLTVTFMGDTGVRLSDGRWVNKRRIND